MSDDQLKNSSSAVETKPPSPAPSSASSVVSARALHIDPLTASHRHPGERIGRYRVEAELGDGGMGRVVLAFDELLNRRVAIKVLRSKVRKHESAAEMLRRFENEAILAAGTYHPHLITVYERGEDNGCPYTVLEYPPGAETLASLVEETRKKSDTAVAAGKPPVFMDLDFLIEIGLQVAAGLRAFHFRGLIHRDLKLENILVAPLSAGGWLAKIIDFGIAHDPALELTQDGIVMGTPGYLSPESFQLAETTHLALDHRTDLYALGIVFYRCLTLQYPYGEATGLQLQQVYHIHKERIRPVPPSHHRPGLSPAWDELVLALLAHDREQRPQSAAAVQHALLKLRGGPLPYYGDGLSPYGEVGTYGHSGQLASASSPPVDLSRFRQQPTAPDFGPALRPRRARRIPLLRRSVYGLLAVAGVVAVLLWRPWVTPSAPQETETTPVDLRSLLSVQPADVPANSSPRPAPAPSSEEEATQPRPGTASRGLAPRSATRQLNPTPDKPAENPTAQRRRGTPLFALPDGT